MYRRNLLLDSIDVDKTKEKASKDTLLCEASSKLNNKRRVEVFQSDFKRIEYGKWLNDTLIEFLINTAMENYDEEILSSLHVFSTQFYTKLVSTPRKWTSALLRMPEAKRNHANVEKWTKNINIFEKQVHIFPINKTEWHWYLIIAIFPTLSDSCEPYLAVLDSCGQGKLREDEADNIRNYFVEELAYRSEKSFNSEKIKKMLVQYPKVPQQPDGSSCLLCIFSSKY